MEWEKVYPELRDLLEKSMSPFDCQKKFMFGTPTYSVNGHTFAARDGK
jgi:hypothetical protein